MKIQMLTIFIGACATSLAGQASPLRVSVNDLNPARIHLSAANHAQIGEAVSLAGDLTGDGYIEIAIGAPAFSPGALEVSEHHGAVFVLFGHEINLNNKEIDLNDSRISAFCLIGESGSHLGASLADVGDINSDGFDDIAIGAPGEPAGIILFGRPEWRRVIHFSDLRGEAVIVDNTGQYTTSAGDLNQNGYRDVLFGHPIGGGSDGGLLTVVFGGQTIPRRLNALRSGQHHVSLSGAHLGRLGASAAGKLIISSHGRTDIAALAKSPENGKALIFRGGAPFTPKLDEARTIHGARRFIHNAGDVNGSGYTEIAIGADNNRAWLLWGRNFDPGGIDLNADAPQSWGVLLDDAPLVAAIGDVDGDGYNDMAIGLPDATVDDMEQAGTVVILFGSSNWPNRINVSRIIQGESSRIRSMVIHGSEPFSRFGAAIHGGSDVQGDGFADLIVGAPSLPEQPGSGAAYVIQGRVIHKRINSSVSSLPFRR